MESLVPLGLEARQSGDLTGAIAEWLRHRILEGDLPAGAKLNQAELAETLGVSRTPVREALHQLEAARLVVRYPHRGAIVRTITARECLESYHVRAELEALAASLAAPRLTAEELRTLRKAGELFELSVERFSEWEVPEEGTRTAESTWIEANDLFHSTILAAAANSELAYVVLSLHHRFPRDLTRLAIGRSIGLARQNAQHHERIRLALERGDAERAREEMKAHILRAGELVARWLDARHGTSAHGMRVSRGS